MHSFASATSQRSEFLFYEQARRAPSRVCMRPLPRKGAQDKKGFHCNLEAIESHSAPYPLPFLIMAQASFLYLEK